MWKLTSLFFSKTKLKKPESSEISSAGSGAPQGQHASAAARGRICHVGFSGGAADARQLANHGRDRGGQALPPSSHPWEIKNSLQMFDS